METAVCHRLTAECEAVKAKLVQQAKFPLLSIASKPNGKPHTISIDFVIVDARGPAAFRAIDAKSNRVSRDWPLRAAAFRETYGVQIEEVSK